MGGRGVAVKRRGLPADPLCGAVPRAAVRGRRAREAPLPAGSRGELRERWTSPGGAAPHPCPAVETGRGARVRTGGLLLPKQARYQAAPRPDARCGTGLSYHNRRSFPSVPPPRGGGSPSPRAPSAANAFDNPCYVPLPFSPMSVISDAISERQSQIERLQAEIKALSDVEKMLGDSAPQPRRRARRSPTPRKPAPAAAAPAPADTASEAKPRRKRRQMTPEEKKAVSERMTAYWAARRKKSGK